MNVIATRQEQRMKRIAQMTESINKAKDPDLDKLALMCCANWGISLRTAKEYLKIALFNKK